MHQSAGVAQLVEQLTCNEKVEGSIPFSGTNYPSLAQSGSASGLGPEGREFESLITDQSIAEYGSGHPSGLISRESQVRILPLQPFTGET